MKEVFKRIYAWLGGMADKALHALVCFCLIILSALFFSIEQFWIGAIIALVLSIIKEVLDEWVYKGADIKDLLADAVGIAAACTVCLISLWIREVF